MDCNNFYEEYIRMCHSYEDCIYCSLHNECDAYHSEKCKMWVLENLPRAMEIVEKWGKDNPKKKKRYQIFTKECPQISISNDGYPGIAPCFLDRKLYEQSELRKRGRSCRYKNCVDCRKRYWEEEVEGEYIWNL